MAEDYKDCDSYRLFQEIPPVELRVGATPTSVGRVEKYDHASRLMHRLDEIGRRQLVILSMSEAGQPHTQIHVDALTHYLHSCKGLRSLKRVFTCRMVYNKYAWAELRARLNIPQLAIIVSV